MSEIREIVTRAVVAKGKKLVRIKTSIPTNEKIEKILGCWVTTTEITTELLDHKVQINGSFDTNIWYETENNKSTNLAKSTTSYEDIIKVRDISCNLVGTDLEVVTCLLQQPTCTNACITENGIEVEVLFEMLAEVIGETKILVTAFACQETNDTFDDFENEINEDFLNEES